MSDKRETPLRLSSKPTRPVVRDISESLGKMPPQAPEIERELIGAILSESNLYDKVKEFMRSEYFYSEANQHIYAAIQEVVQRGGGISPISVIQILRENGRLEIVGGAYAVSEIHSTSSFNAKVEFNARVIIEKYIKRELIQNASKSHQEAYDEFTDPIIDLEDAIKRLEYLKDKVFKPQRDQVVKKMWEAHHLTTKPEENPFMLYVGGVGVVRAGGQMLVIGKKKSRKSLFVIMVIVEYLKTSKTNGDDVLIFDTEQSRYHAWRLREKIHTMTGKYVNVFSLLGLSPPDRMNLIADTCKYWPTPPQLIIADGTRDLMHDINDPKETTDIMTWIQQLTMAKREGQPYNPCIINILHLNKTDSNPRGHIGTELQNKAECTIELSLDEKTGCTDVKCESSREKPFTSFSFTHDENEMPMIINVGAAGGDAVKADDRRRRLLDIYREVPDGMLSRGELEKAIKEHFKVGNSRAGQDIAEFKRLGWIITIGAFRSPTQRYKIMIYDAVTPVQPTPNNGHEPGLFDAPPLADSHDDEVKFTKKVHVKSPDEPKFDTDDLPF